MTESDSGQYEYGVREPQILVPGGREPINRPEQLAVNAYSQIPGVIAVYSRWRPATGAWPIMRIYIRFERNEPQWREMADNASRELAMRCELDEFDLETLHCFDDARIQKDAASKIYVRLSLHAGLDGLLGVL